MQAQFQIVSPLSLNECVQRLKLSMDPSSVWNGVHPVRGTVTLKTLRACKQINYQSSFQTLLIGQFYEQDGKTHIICRTGMSQLVYAFMIVWFGSLILGVVGILLFFIIKIISSQHPLLDSSLFELTPLFMILFGYGLVKFVRYMARDESQF